MKRDSLHMIDGVLHRVELTGDCNNCGGCCRGDPLQLGKTRIRMPDRTHCRHWTKSKRCAIYAKRPWFCEAWPPCSESITQTADRFGDECSKRLELVEVEVHAD